MKTNGRPTMARTLGYLIVLTPLMSMMSSSSFGDEYSAPSSVGLHCHFVPYSHCYLTWSGTTTKEGICRLKDDLEFKFEYGEVELYPGFYDLTISTSEKEHDFGAAFRVEGRKGRVDLDHPNRLNPERVKQFCERSSGTISIRTSRIPWVVLDDGAKHTLLSVTAKMGEDSINTSSAYLEPVKHRAQCWLNEPSCVD